MSAARLPVFFISFGGPEGPDDIMPFLERVTKGRGIPRERLLGVAEHYHHIGGRSPINEITRRQVEALRRELGETQVYLGQRNWTPFIEEALRAMKDEGVKKAVAFCTAPYRCEASLERYVEAVNAARAAIGDGAPEIAFVGPWFDHPLFIDAIAARVEEARFPKGIPWVFTAHSIPCGMAKESSYVEELRACAERVAKKFGHADWSLAFTSRSGNPRDAWLEPDISKVIAAKAAAGIKELCLIPFGFVADHVEVLYDLDVEARAAADKLHVRLRRAQTVGDHPLFIKMIAEVVRSCDGKVPGAVSSKRKGPSEDCYCFPGAADQPCKKTPSKGERPAH